MIDKKDVIEFFDKRAASWDAELIRKDSIVNIILDNGGVTEGVHVLDVACGTGVLFGDYLKRNVASVTGIDISPEMARIATEKFPQENIKVICGDVEETEFDKTFDVAMVYNAFPHFPNPARLIETLAKNLKKGGRLSVAHGMSRAKIDSHHSSVSAHQVTMGLMHEKELAKLFEPYFEVDIIISNDDMYQVSGIKK
ncbi:MAG: class I SAM-dependent methyltransferase [Bacillota bacterium]|nr:class I SAM-dependent methyltransferase [Bacillota bacterium]